MDAISLPEVRKNKRSLAITGFASTSRHLTPWSDPNIKIWLLNKSHLNVAESPDKVTVEKWVGREADAYFQLHPISYLKKCMGQSEGDRIHYEWLCQPHKFPLYCYEKYPEFPSSVQYPLEDMFKRFGKFFTSTFAFQAALAITQGFEHVEIYGFDMNNDTEYREQRDSAEYFMGIMQDMGISVYLPPACPLLKGKIYAFNSVEIGLRQLYEFRTPALKNKLSEETATFNQLAGYLQQIKEIVKTKPEMKGQLEQRQKEIDEQGKKLYEIQGAMKENLEALKLFDKFYNLSSEI
jgi:hypothetical protein